MASLFRKVASRTPQGQAGLLAYDNRNQAKKLAKVSKGSKNPKTASAAKVLAKAKAGDPKAKKDIVKVNKMAKAGDPRAKEAVQRLDKLNKLTRGGIVNRAYNAGIT